MKPMLPTLQKQYDAMVKIAKQSIARDVDLTPAFEREMLLLTRVIVSLGGKV